MLEDLLRQCVDRPGVKYIRVGRKNNALTYRPGSRFEIGKAIQLRPGGDVTLIACGIMVHEAMQTAATLAGEGIQAQVLDMFTVKPLDVEAVVRCAAQTGALVTCENHNKVGGLYSAVAEALAANRPTPLEYVAVEDEFGEVGPQDYLQQRFGLTAGHIVQKAKAAVARKKCLTPRRPAMFGRAPVRLALRRPDGGGPGEGGRGRGLRPPPPAPPSPDPRRPRQRGCPARSAPGQEPKTKSGNKRSEIMLLKDKGFLSSFFSLYWSIVLQNVVVLSVNLVDNIMLGAYSESALSGAAAVNQLQFFLQMVINGFGGGLVVLLSQYWAQGRSQPIRRLTAIGLWGGIGVSLALLAACWALPRQLLSLFTAEADIIAEASNT